MVTRRSEVFIPTLRDAPGDATQVSHAFMVRAGMVRQLGAGIYTQLPLFFNIRRRLEEVIRQEMAQRGAEEFIFPAIQPVSIWEEAGRYQVFGDDMFSFDDRHARKVCMAPTHEVAAAVLAKGDLGSYKSLPRRLYQIQSKYRDEVRPRGGVLRTREFTMHDLYSFDVGPEAAQVSYDLIYNAYLDIFRRVGIPILPIPSVDTGEIGGDNSHEFICLTPTGESVVWVSPNKEQARLGEAGGCQVEANWHQEKGLELAHTFQLGYQYTKPLDVLFVDRDGSRHNIYMCSFGLGVERTIAALLEVGLTRGPQFSWPWSIAPYHVNIIVASPTAHLDAATAFANELDMVGIRTIVDDRDTRVGSKFNDSQLLGAPIDLVFGSNYPDVEVIDRIAGEKVIASREDALAIIQKAWREAVS